MLNIIIWKLVNGRPSKLTLLWPKQNKANSETWCRPVPLLPEDKTGRFGIGEEFLKQPDAVPDVFGGAVTKLPEINKSLK
jgi:hypothetical protein